MNETINKKSLNNKLDLILTNQKKILKNEKEILGEEVKLEEDEKEELKKEDINLKTEEEALKELEKLEISFKKNLSSPINKITKRDLFKGFIGAFVGMMGHFAFYKATDIATNMSMLRATILYIIAFMIIVIMLYYTGFKKVKKDLMLKFMPQRALILYTVSIIAVIIINLLFGKIHFPLHFNEIYILVGTSIILAVMGAGTADLIGGSGE